MSYDTFLRLFTADRDRLFAYIFSLLPRRADAEDVFQRCSLILWNKFDQFDPEESFFAWASGVAFYEVKNFLRSAGRERLHFSVDLVTQLAEDRRNSEFEGRRVAALESCLEKLAERDRDLIRAAYWTRTPLNEVAVEGGMALQSVYNRLGLVRRRLFECVHREMADPLAP
ncbi:sigma-70 family RNA polymerase sigma factor [Stratiformator vulcanicus]|uniref:sigma-70 family RNA polymerase sigma factor n=1 Tax=Stratiformator vulcanicus TaxID=2527980 RepID=UPI002877DE28|nr:sigma-70 family RNA polymerase sigma factor [Stratiformator vulcanicus]